MASQRVLVIGLDCAAPQLAFERFRDKLPAIRNLCDEGVHGTLRSCDPPTTVPAWSTMTSYCSLGSLGIYGFRNRVDHGYGNLALADSTACGSRASGICCRGVAAASSSSACRRRVRCRPCTVR